jgi:hypothetical protein
METKNNQKKSLMELLTCLDASSDSIEIKVIFKEIAVELFSNYHIQKGDRNYELLEIEFYFFSNNHKDIITYPRTSDRPGMWFFHMSGVDITFGSKAQRDNNFYGGILIRSMIRTDVSEPLPISGPMKCVEELFDYINAVDHNVKNDIPCIVRNDEIGYIPTVPISIDRNLNYCPRFIPFRVKANENIEAKIKSKLEDLKRRRELEIEQDEFKNYLKAEYRYYIECDEEYWNSKYSACPLKSKRDKNDNRFLCK